MISRIVVTGTGCISSLGDSSAGLHTALCNGLSGLRPIELFNTEGLSCRQGGEITSFSPKTYLGDKNLRPLDRTSQLVAAAVGLVLKDSCISSEIKRGKEVGLVLGTMFCSVRTIAEFDRRALTAGPSYASPMDFANTVISAAAGQTAIWHNLRGVNSTISTGIPSGLQAIAYAADLIRTGRASAVIAGGVEEMCFESFYGLHQAGLLCGSSDSAGEFPIPFDARRNGMAAGEGAALLMLEDAESARARGGRILGEIKGHGSGFDNSRGRDGTKSVRAVSRAIVTALTDAQMASSDIDCVSASANGSVHWDWHEARGLACAFRATAHELPVTAIKSNIGETLGASGAFQTLALLETLREGTLPGIRQLEKVQDGFPLGGARPGNTKINPRNGLVNSVGLEGNTCALAVGKWDGGGS